MSEGKKIHDTAVISPKAVLGKNVRVGPFCYVGHNVTIGEGCTLEAYVHLGIIPVGYKSPGGIEIGEGNHFASGTKVESSGFEDKATRIGRANYFFSGVFIGHDTSVGNSNVITNGTQVAGHCRVGNYANIGGLAGLHQWIAIGDYSFVAGMTKVTKSVPPFVAVASKDGNTRPFFLNLVGAERYGVNEDERNKVRAAYKILAGAGSKSKPLQKSLPELKSSLEELESRLEEIDSRHAENIFRFIQNECKLGRGVHLQRFWTGWLNPANLYANRGNYKTLQKAPANAAGE